MRRVTIIASLLSAALSAGCATDPMGPTARVMPAPGKPFEAFARDQAMCKQFADSQVGGGANMSNLKQFGGVALSTVLGAGLGAAVHRARGAEIGGGLGAIAGSLAAGRGSAADQYGLQSRYDLAYTQCMYAQGNQVPSAAPASPRVAYGPRGGNPMPPGPSGRGNPAGQPGAAEYGAPWTQ